MKKLFTLSISLFISSFIFGQNWIGFANSNYSGINGVYLNPSSIADSRYAVNANLVGFGVGLNNNYVSYQSDPNNKKSLLNALFLDKNSELNNSNFTNKINGKDKTLNLYGELRGPSVMVSLNTKNSIGFTTRIRTFINAFDVGEPLARILQYGRKPTGAAFNPSLSNSPLEYGKEYNNSGFNLNANVIAEYGLTYGVVLLNDDKNFLKAGISVKKISGLYSFYMNGDGGLTVHTNDSISFNNANVSYGYINEGNFNSENGIDLKNLYKNAMGSGIGVDLGLTYEYRPDAEKYKLKSGGNEIEDRKQNKYKYRISGSLLDLGSVKYKGNNSQVNAYKVKTFNQINWGSLDTLANYLNDFESSPNRSALVTADSAIGYVFGFNEQLHEFKSNLPMALNLNFDYKIISNVYVNLNWYQSLRKKSKIGMRQQSSLSLTPRFESKWWDVSLPMSLNNDYSNLDLGMFVRLGVFYFGSDNISSVFKKNNVYGADIYAGFIVPIFKRNPSDAEPIKDEK